MDSTQVPEQPNHRNERGSQGGIALFMVLSAMTILSVLVTEFTYIAQINAKMAFDGLDQVKALYLAKSGFKLSLLRLKAYQNVKAAVGTLTGNSGNSAVPKQLFDKIWNMPYFYPFPANLPGLSTGDKDTISKFEKASGLDGKFSAIIESESARYNLNMILGGFIPTAGPSASPSPGVSTNPSPSPSPSPTFDAQQARQSLQDYLGQILDQKIQDDQDFAAEYRDIRMDDLMDQIWGWADASYEPRIQPGRDQPPLKRAPFYSLSELHMIHGIDDNLYNLWSPSLTVTTTPGINVNTIQDATLHALVPQMTKEERDEYFKFRDDEESDNNFKKDEDFFSYISKNVNVFQRNQQAFTDYKAGLEKRNIRIVTDETQFKVTVRAEVNKSSRLIEAWVTLLPLDSTSTNTKDANKNPAPTPTPQASAGPGQLVGPDGQPRPSSGLKITFMRIL